jgi:hypothetical protein
VVSPAEKTAVLIRYLAIFRERAENHLVERAATRGGRLARER